MVAVAGLEALEDLLGVPVEAPFQAISAIIATRKGIGQPTVPRIIYRKAGKYVKVCASTAGKRDTNAMSALRREDSLDEVEEGLIRGGADHTPVADRDQEEIEGPGLQGEIIEGNELDQASGGPRPVTNGTPK